jgi:hypothetical protein
MKQLKGSKKAQSRIQKHSAANRPPNLTRRHVANIENAQHSTGPRTDVGKAIVRNNALTHGILAKSIDLGSERGEDPRLFAKLVADVVESTQPVGPEEEMFVEIIATGYCRLARVFRFEAGCIRELFDACSIKRSDDDSERFDKDIARLWSPIPATGILEYPRGVAHIIEILKTAHSQLEENGYIDQSDTMRISNLFGNDRSSLGYTCDKLGDQELRRFKERIAKNETDTEVWPDKHIALQMITEKIRELSLRLDNLKKRGSFEIAQESLKSFLPSEADSNRILRYAAQIENSIHRAFDRLEKLQSQRLGRPARPSIDVNLS